MIKYAIKFIDEDMYLESDQYVDSETNESPMVSNIEDALLYDNEEKAFEILVYKKEDGYNCKIVEVKVSYQVI